MAPFSVREIEQRITQIAEQDEFGDDLLFDLLLAYGRSQSNATRLRKAATTWWRILPGIMPRRILSTSARLPTATLLPPPAEREAKLLDAVQHLRTHERVVHYNTRFVIATGYHWLAAVDIKPNENRIFPGALRLHTLQFIDQELQEFFDNIARRNLCGNA